MKQSSQHHQDNRAIGVILPRFWRVIPSYPRVKKTAYRPFLAAPWGRFAAVFYRSNQPA